MLMGGGCAVGAGFTGATSIVARAQIVQTAAAI